MYVVIVGCSESGYHLSKALIAGGHEVVVVEKNPARFNLLTEELGSVALLGDGTDEVTLKKAGVSRADVVVSLTGVDATNLVVCQMTKHIFKVPRTMALIKDPKNEPIFHEVGVDVVVNSTHLVLETLEEGIPGRPLVHLMNLRVPGMELVSVSIPEDSDIVGKRGPVAGIAILVISAAVPRTLAGVDGIVGSLHRVTPGDMIEHKELVLRTEERRVGDAG